MDNDKPPCDSSKHQYNEVYYGYKCKICGDFVPFGCEPWIDSDDDNWEDEDEPDLMDEIEYDIQDESEEG